MRTSCVPSPIGSVAADPDLIAAWFARYRRPLIVYFQRRVPELQDPEDLAQEVFLRIFHRASLTDIASVDSYLFLTAQNVLKDYFRRLRSQAEPAGGRNEELMIDPRPDADRTLTEQELFRALLLRLSPLPERTQAVFKLYYFESLTQPEIAETLGIALRTVEDHMARARSVLERSCDLLMVDEDRPPDFGVDVIARGAVC